MMKDITHLIARSLQGKERCHVLVVYEDQETRARATAACDFLVQHFWADTEFEFYWWRQEYLSAPELGERAALNAADADLLFFATQQSPPHQNWFDRWREHRQGRDGLLVQLTSIASSLSHHEEVASTIFARVAGENGLEFVSASLHRPDELIADNEDTSGFRGTDFSPKPGDARQRNTPPSHSGLNE